jgi:hypothetical protein
MNNAITPTTQLNWGSMAEGLNKSVSVKGTFDAAWGTLASGCKSVTEVIGTALPKLMATNNTQFWGLGMKLGGIGLATFAGISLLSNVYGGVKNLLGQPGPETASASAIKSGLDVISTVTAAGMAAGKLNALPVCLAYLASGVFKEMEKLVTDRSRLLEIPIFQRLLAWQANDPNRGTRSMGTSKLAQMNDPFIKIDNDLRVLLGFPAYQSRYLLGDIDKQIQDFVNSDRQVRAESLRSINIQAPKEDKKNITHA